MKITQQAFFKIAGYVLALGALALLFYWRAHQNFLHQDYLNSNFFSYWLSGHMAWTGENPYDPKQWLGNFDAFGATYRPSKILQYPLPLMYFMAPIGWMPVGQAYFVWQVITQIILAIVVYGLLDQWRDRRKILIIPLMIALLFFGPVYLHLQLGATGAIALLAIFLAIILFEKKKPLPAGILLSLTLLKPPQGIPLLTLVGIWLLARRDWKAITGILLGGLALLAIWLIRDPLSLIKFSGSSTTLLGVTLGVQSNVYSFAYLACAQNLPCMWVAGTVAMVFVLGCGAYYLWRYWDQLTAWEAFNLSIPLGFVSALYLWSYDQLLYVIPILWIVGKLIEKTKSYLYAFLFLIVLDVLSFVSLLVQAYTKKDLLSILNTILILGMFLWLMRWKRQSIDKPSMPA